MRRHFHRCTKLRIIAVDASERLGGRGHGQAILEELWEARRLTPRVDLVECDVLTPGQKRVSTATPRSASRAPGRVFPSADGVVEGRRTTRVSSP